MNYTMNLKSKYFSTTRNKDFGENLMIPGKNKKNQKKSILSIQFQHAPPLLYIDFLPSQSASHQKVRQGSDPGPCFTTISFYKNPCCATSLKQMSYIHGCQKKIITEKVKDWIFYFQENFLFRAFCFICVLNTTVAVLCLLVKGLTRS